MLLLPLLIAVVPLVAGECPNVLEGLEEVQSNLTRYAGMVDGIGKIIDVSCGRANFTPAFWSTMTYHGLAFTIAMNNKWKDISPFIKLNPVLNSVKEKFNSIENKEAKSFFDDLLVMKRKSPLLKKKLMTSGGYFAVAVVQETFSVLAFTLSHSLTVDAQIVMAQIVKDSFGVIETREIKRNRIRTAMKAIERVGIATDNDKLAELLAKMYLLVKDDSTIGSSSFSGFAEWAANEWNSTEISHSEVVPAIEVLYVQYHTLNNNESRVLADWVVASFAMTSFKSKIGRVVQEIAFGMEESTENASSTTNIMKEMMLKMREVDEYNKACPSNNGNKCFDDLPNEAQAALKTTFPELFAYLYNDFSPEKFKSGSAAILERINRK